LKSKVQIMARDLQGILSELGKMEGNRSKVKKIGWESGRAFPEFPEGCGLQGERARVYGDSRMGLPSADRAGPPPT
jgi:hypothetical protein